MAGFELLERDHELEMLDHARERATSGTGALVIVEGEAGVGKSSLLAAARERAEAAGIGVLSVRGSEIEREVAFGLARRLIDTPPGTETLAPPAGAEGDERALAVIGALYDALLLRLREPAPGTRSAALMVCVDDAQWADEMSLRFLVHIALRLDGLALALLVGVRLGEPGVAEAPLAELRRPPQARVLRPRALSDDAVTRLARSRLGGGLGDEHCRACAQATGGNPFFVSELLRALAAEPMLPTADRVRTTVPEAVLRAVVVRVGRLGIAPVALARAVAILGDGARLSDAAHLAGLHEEEAGDAADTLARAGVLSAGEPLGFTHPLLSFTLAADLGAFARRREHRRAAHLLAAGGAPPERIAPHLLLVAPAGDHTVASTLRAAAAEADARGDPATAAGMLTRALEEPPADGDRPGILLELARAKALTGAPDADQHQTAALDAIADPHERARALAAMATLAQLTGRHHDAVAHARRGRAELADGDPLEQHLLGLQIGSTLLDPGLGQQPVEELDGLRRRALSGQLPEEPTLLASLALRLSVADPPEVVRRVAQRAIDRGPLLDDDARGGAIGWLASALTFVDELDLAASWLDDAIAHSARRGATIALSVAHVRRATIAVYRGELTAAVSHVQASLDSWGPETTARWAWPALAEAQTLRGDLDAARTAIASGHASGTSLPEYAFLLTAQSLLELAQDQPADALATAQTAGEMVTSRYHAVPARINPWRTNAARAAVRLGRAADARQLLTPALDELRATGPARPLGAALIAAGLATNGPEAITLLEQAVEVLNGSPARLTRAEALTELGGALRRDGQRRAARDPLYQALELATRSDAQPLAERARAELRSLGDRPRRDVRTGVESLTPTERRIAMHAARGLTTPQIARQLVVTNKTVETHLSHIYQKLGISGRKQLPASLAEQPAPRR